VRFIDSRIEFYYSLLKNKTIELQNRKMEFKKGDQIVVAVSYHLKKSDFEKFIKMYFDEAKFFISGDESYVLAMCRK
jgi:hypothetical protein